MGTRAPASVSASPQVLGTGLPPALRALLDAVQIRRERTVTDRSLARRLHAAVRAERLPALGVSFYVHDGAVSLYGTVPDAAARDALVTLAAHQPGVRRIVDHLRLRPATDA